MNESVSIIIPYHNEGELLARSVQSVVSQEFDGVAEVIVVDDCSEIVPSLPPELRSKTKVIRSNEPLFASGARNLGVQHATSPWIAFLDADDAFLPGRLQAHLAFVRQQPDVSFVGGKWEVHREGRVEVPVPAVILRLIEIEGKTEEAYSRQLLPESARPLLCLEYPFHTSSITVRRDRFLRSGGFNAMHRWGEEWDLMVRLSQHGPIGFVNHIGSSYLCRENSICSTLNPEKFESGASMFTQWQSQVEELSAKDRRHLRRQAAQYWMLAAQTRLEKRDSPGQVLRCCVRSFRQRPRRWPITTALRAAAASFRPTLKSP